MGNCLNCRRARSFTPTGSIGPPSPEIPHQHNIILTPRVDPNLLLLDAVNSTVSWNQSDNAVVGDTTVATIQFLRRNRDSYTLESGDRFQCFVNCVESEDTPIQYILEPSESSIYGSDSVRISFIARRAGIYIVTLTINDEPIGGIVHYRTFRAGPPDPRKTEVVPLKSRVIMKYGDPQDEYVCFRDVYSNIAVVDTNLLSFEASSMASVPVNTNSSVTEENVDGKTQYLLKWTIHNPGCYNGHIEYNGNRIGFRNGIDIICLSEEGMMQVNNNLRQLPRFVLYEGQKMKHGKKKCDIRCSLSQQIFQVKRKTLKLIFTKLLTCKVRHSTQIVIHSESGLFTVDAGGINHTITLNCPNRDVLVATFYKILEKNAGGVISFADKQKHFYSELTALSNGEHDQEIRVNVERSNLLNSMMAVTKNFKINDWKKNFFVTFADEQGYDAGGVSRELFNLICEELFSAKPNGLFMRFNDSPQCLVHPSPQRLRDRTLTLKHYEFAGRIVGKCLYESALGNPLYVKAHFTRSFLALVIGLRVTWKYFETDDPELYKGKIMHILDNGVEGLDLTFSEEVFATNGGAAMPRTISFGKRGHKKTVTDDNKMEYLDELTRYRLVDQVSDETHQFLKGLNELVPDEQLSIFTENELELLMCGLQEYSFDDLKQNANVSSRNGNADFLRSVEWFWAIVRDFSQEEMARLVQFITGSSQLPPGGFKELQPPFLIASSGYTPNRLPYAQTCFNHLYLSNCTTFEQFRRLLMTALNEGNKGFLLE